MERVRTTPSVNSFRTETLVSTNPVKTSGAGGIWLMDIASYVAAILVAMVAGVVFFVVGSPPSASTGGFLWIGVMLETIARATPVVLVVALGIGYPLAALARRRGLHWAVTLVLAGLAGLALGLVALVIAPFIPGLSEFPLFVAIYAAVIGVWCAVGGQLLYPVFRRHPIDGMCAGALVIALAVAGWWLGL